MRVLGITEKNSGCGWHRITLPLACMQGVKGKVTNLPVREILAEGWDIVLFNRISVFDSNFDEVRNTLNCKVILDLDDDWDLPYTHPLYYNYDIFKKRIIQNIKDADAVTVTHERLAKKVEQYNSNVYVIPNAIPFDFIQYNSSKIISDNVRIFWAGGSTHENDLKIVSNPIKRLNYPNIQMVLGGYTDTDQVSKHVWTRMFNLFTDNGRHNWKLLHSAPVTHYMDHYQHADIMLVPLEATKWHSYKSNLKLLEAACKRIPCIVSNVPPYNDDLPPVLWVDKQTDWIKHITALIKDKDMREDYGNALYFWAKENYNLYDVNEHRKRVFESVARCETDMGTLQKYRGNSQLLPSLTQICI